MDITINVSPGELIDKITVLEIKREEITDVVKQANVVQELEMLKGQMKRQIPESVELARLSAELRSVNKKIWDSENDVREFWNDDSKCLEAAKRSHFNNDERARVKRAINVLLGSPIVEEKSHPKYEHKP